MEVARAEPAGQGSRSRTLSPSVGWSAGERATRTLLLAAAVTGFFEVLLQRIAPPLLGQVVAPAASIHSAVSWAGDAAASATMVLVYLAAVGWVVARWRHASLLMLVACVTLLAAWWPSAASSVLLQIAVMAAAGMVGHTLLRRGVDLYGVAVLVAVGAVAAGHWPLLVDAAGGSGGLGVRSIAEAGAVTAPLLLALAAAGRDVIPVRGWGGALAGGVVAAGAIVFGDSFAAVGATWAIGATLALPPMLYIAGAAGFGLVVATWVTRDAARPLVAALVLLAVAGIQPAVIHHSLTALLALAVLACPSVAAPLSADTEKGIENGPVAP